VSVPVLVIVSGPPAAGKTTLAAALGKELRLPVFDRDDLKDSLFDTLGWSDRAWSQRLGLAAYELLYLVADRLLARGVSVILDTNFQRDALSKWLGELRARYDFALVEVHCSAAPELMARRFRERWESGDRHPGHTGEFTDEAAFIAALDARDYRPVGIGTVIGVDTTDPERVDLGHVITTIREGMDGPEDR
jgi:predicted kinase